MTLLLSFTVRASDSFDFAMTQYMNQSPLLDKILLDELETHTSIVSQVCAEAFTGFEIEEPDIVGFNVVGLISVSGKIEEVWVNSDTKQATCFKEDLKGLSFSTSFDVPTYIFIKAFGGT